MKKILLLLIVITIVIPKQTKAQEAETAAAVAGGLLALGAGIATVELLQEQAELKATEWILLNQPELTNFSLKTLSLEGSRLKDMSFVSVISFEIQEFTPTDDPIPNGEKLVLFGFTSMGWINEFGINFSKIKWHLIDKKEWIKMMTAYVKVSSDEDDVEYIQEQLIKGEIVDRGVRIKNKLVIPFYRLDGDMYLVTDYSSDMKLIYNERSLGIFLKETGDLVQIGRNDIMKIHDFFYYENEN